MIRTLCLGLCLLSLSGCLALTSSAPPVTTYALHASRIAPDADSSYGPGGILRIEEPVLPAGLDSDRIALYTADGRRLDYYAAAKWPAALNSVLQDVMIEEGRKALPRMVVDTPDLNVTANYKLAVRVIDFAPVYRDDTTTAPFLKVSANFTLIRLPENEVVLDFTLENGQPASANSLTAVTSGLEAQFQHMMQQAYGSISESMLQKDEI